MTTSAHTSGNTFSRFHRLMRFCSFYRQPDKNFQQKIGLFLILCCSSAITLQAQQVETGVATYFDGIGAPYGGCGVPELYVETADYVALNVFNTPGDATQYTRPIPGSNSTVMGEFKNGNNCGRWIKVTVLENCQGTNDGALGMPFCRGTNASWINDQYSGSQLNMIVTDACGNGWCRDSPYHLDLHKSSLSQFDLNGQKSTGMFPDHFNNRKIQWEYIEAPGYSGDIDIYMMQGAQRYYAPVLINHLRNGIHSMEQKVGGVWMNVPRYADMGQAFLLPDLNSPYTIRITDANDAYVENGREYTFSFPSTCGNSCSPPATPVSYTTFDPSTLAVDAPALQEKAGIRVVSTSGEAVRMQLAPAAAQPTTLRVFDLLGRQVVELSKGFSPAPGWTELGMFAPGMYNLVLYAPAQPLRHVPFFVGE